ncbi:uncharacterized protein LOC105833583 [Monomorium pharaonis]|uniref:uncharacterized protein LOC105833583 n=1 Tax=Monomorium pharaonis TaxID=307658 RepID=UPI00063FCB3D|nr:uncharacterized protein LOC105833583 [Monomorium pharaonis]
MSVFMQRLSHPLRGAYSALLRLGCDNGNHPCRVLGAISKRRYNTPNTVWINPGRAQDPAMVSAVIGVSKEAANKDGYVVNEDDIYTVQEYVPENTYAHNFFLNSLKYANTVMQPGTTYACVTNEEALNILEQDWSSITSTETVSAVKKLSYNINQNNEKIEPLKYMKAFNTLNLQKLTDNDVMTVMRHLVPFSTYMTQCDFYNNLCERIDRECMIRFLHLPIEKMLYLCDVMYQITPKHGSGAYFYKFYSQYVWYSIRHLGNKPHKLSPEQLVQVLFFLNVYRKPPINMYELEFRLEQCIDDLSIKELAIAALGFFKTRTKIRNKVFLNNIIHKTIAEIDTVDTVSIGGIIKLIRYSMQLTEVRSFIDLLKVLTPYVSRYTLMSLAHISQACGRIAVYDKKFMDKIIKRLNEELQTARLKDIERFLFTFSILNIDSSIYQNIVEELRGSWDTTRASEIKKFPSVPARILGYMAVQNVYPKDLIKRVMTPEYVIKTCFGNYKYLSREYCVLDYGLRIEVPEYDGPFLKPNVRTSIEKKYYDLAAETKSESTWANSLFSDVLATCQKLFNTTSDILVTRPLPHFAVEDIIFCLDEQNQLVPSEKFLSQFESSDIKPVNEETSNKVRWIALVIGHHGLLIRNFSSPTGPLAAKLRQLSIIGYTPIMILNHPWNINKTSQEKCDYLRKLIFRDDVSKLSNTV